MSIRLIDALGLLAGGFSHPGNDDNEKYLWDERLNFAAQRIHERTGEPKQTILDAAFRYWQKHDLTGDPDLSRLYPVFG